ncbi:PTS sugar transporter subunit IIA [Olsenella sp. Marseille-P4559]|uniref:PTS sugar transporter subunit IIA n=1 Tax=Olsenella sp. Marseille-P4559 TaxID=2364795 RepID=UPI00103118D3|nr:pts system, mannose/fructose/sorbose family, iiab component [Olsenella sp. Marseille-P4559]
MSRHYIIASHAHFAQGIYESVKLLSGERDDVTVINAFVDGNDDVARVAAATVDALPTSDDIVVLTDLLGGSVNNEFTKLMITRPHVYLVTNMNLPLLLTLFLSDDAEDTKKMLSNLVASDDVRPKLCDASAIGEDEDF